MKGSIEFSRREVSLSVLAWLLQLVSELDEWDHARADQWRDWLRPLESIAVERLSEWIPKLAYPIRIGEHDQTAFAFGLARTE